MNRKTIAIVGVGPSIGMSLARKFGREGYRVGLISRSREKLTAYVSELQQMNVEAAAFPADVKDRSTLQKAIAGIQDRFGAIDVLEYSPLLDLYSLVDVVSLNVDQAQEQIDFQLMGAITSVRAVLPQMIDRSDGALLFTVGVSAHTPAPSHANGAIGVTALRQYALMLHMALKSKGIYVGMVGIAKLPQPEEVAQIYWQKVTERTGCETLYGDPRYLTIYEDLVGRGYARDYPPELLKDLPVPKDESERNSFLISLYHIRGFILAGQGSGRDAALARVTEQALRLGGLEQAPFFGGDIDKVLRPIEVMF